MGSLVLGGDADDVAGMSTVGRHARGRVKVPTPRWMNATTSQGVSRPQEEMDFLPFDALTLPLNDDGTGTLVNTTGVLIARPQRPFRGERLILGAVNGDGDFIAGMVIDPAIYVGAVQVGASQGSTPFATFGAQAFGVRLSLPAAGQGTEVKIFVRNIVASTDSGIQLSATIIGRAMR